MNETPALPRWRALDQAKVLSELSCGPVADSWLIEQAGQQRVFRRDRTMAARLGLDRRGEQAVLAAASAAGLGPGLIAADPDNGWLVTEYLVGQAAGPDEFRRPEALQQIGRLLARLHQLPVSTSAARLMPEFDAAGAVLRYARLVGKPQAHTLAEQVRADLARLESGAMRASLCHNDIHPGNIVLGEDGRMRFIDWEYAALGPPEFELAALIELAALSSAEQQGLLEAYARSGGIAPGPALTGWRAVYAGLSRLWSMALRQADI